MPPIPPDHEVSNREHHDSSGATEADDASLINNSNTVKNGVANNDNVVVDSEPDNWRNSPISDPVAFSDDEASGHMMERDYTGMFEGPEKTLEVVFRRLSDEHIDSSMGEVIGDDGVAIPSTAATPVAVVVDNISGSNSTDVAIGSSGGTNNVGLRRLKRPDLDRICARARCTILSSISNQYLDAYVLSESSLFIYPYMLVLKTCGTTTLLRCIATLIEMGHKLGLEIDWVGYSRKNFNFPGDQAFPHQSFHQELDYLYGHRNLCERLDGSGYTLGPVTGDHWFVFVADQTVRAKALDIDTDRVLNIMMFDIDEEVAKLFYYNHYDCDVAGETKDEEVARISKEMTVCSGINSLCPGSVIDPRAFEPCGYSMNAILFRSYSTIHITPESGSSYASFETNQKVGSYKSLISNVVRTFRPKRFVMTLMADEGGLKQIKENPMVDAGAAAKIVVPAVGAMTPALGKDNGKCMRSSFVTISPNTKALVYKRSSVASIKVEEDCCCMMGNWVLEKTDTPAVLLRANKERGMTIS